MTARQTQHSPETRPDVGRLVEALRGATEAHVSIRLRATRSGWLNVEGIRRRPRRQANRFIPAAEFEVGAVVAAVADVVASLEGLPRAS